MPYVQLEFGKIHYRMKGNGPVLFILHGLGNNAQSWDNQLEELSKSFRVIAWDAPGYGKSSDPHPDFETFQEFSDVLNKVLEKLKIKSVFLLGHSMGAAIAIDFAYRFAEKVDKLVLSDPPRGAAVVTESKNKAKLNNRIYAIDVEGPEALAKKRTRNLFSSYASEELIERAEQIMSQVRGPGYRSVSYSLYNLDQTMIFNKISAPTLVICGELDNITPPEDSKFIHDRLQDSTLQLIPRTGHLCYMEDPDSFNGIVEDFLIEKK
ncbi:alpha/beta fold hydrolase [Bacillus piscicola]|uniref:alpha/beta fold hydrolase n=1 Tax=Bacillus piscicola TaxID=1632684 RepID=UPI001F09EA1F|nr:alpha/beta hydrolase [Bacillus piscicola]